MVNAAAVVDAVVMNLRLEILFFSEPIFPAFRFNCLLSIVYCIMKDTARSASSGQALTAEAFLLEAKTS